MKQYRPLWVALLVLALATPLGLYMPELMRAGTAWGEWGLQEIEQLIGYVPPGMERLSHLWKAPLPGYSLPGQAESPLLHRSFSYILSALLGIGLCGGAALVVTRWLVKKRG